jgi:hypothetical protein
MPVKEGYLDYSFSDEGDSSSDTDSSVDPHFARSLLAFTAKRGDHRKRPLISTSLPESHQRPEEDPQGFVSRRVVLGGFSGGRASLNGSEGTVTGQHHLAKTYLVALEESGRVVHAPAGNLFLVFDVNETVASVGGAYDEEDGGVKKPEKKAEKKEKKRGVQFGERYEGEETVRLDNCHDFKWSGTLWAEAANHTAKLSALLFAAWVLMSWGLLGYNQGLGVLDSMYLLAATITTVGIGDLYPANESSRIAAIFLIPMGLVVLCKLFVLKCNSYNPPKHAPNSCPLCARLSHLSHAVSFVADVQRWSARLSCHTGSPAPFCSKKISTRMTK